MNREELYIYGYGETATYSKSEADSVMDAMEARIKELEDSKHFLLRKVKEYMDEKERLKAIIATNEEVPMWINVKDRLPSNQDMVIGLVVGTDLVTKDWTPELNERIKRTEMCYYVDGDGWYSSEGYQMVVSPRMWIPLPPPPTDESSATEKENG